MKNWLQRLTNFFFFEVSFRNYVTIRNDTCLLYLLPERAFSIPLSKTESLRQCRSICDADVSHLLSKMNRLKSDKKYYLLQNVCNYPT
jgi:hypothetical protein